MKGDIHRPQRPTGNSSAARSAPPTAWFNRYGGAGCLCIPCALTGRDVPAFYKAPFDLRSAPDTCPLPTGADLESASRSFCLGSVQGIPDSFLVLSRSSRMRLVSGSARPRRVVSPYACLAGSPIRQPILNARRTQTEGERRTSLFCSLLGEENSFFGMPFCH